MSTEANKAVVRRWIEEIWNGGNVALVDELFSPDYRAMNPFPGMDPTRDGFRQLVVRTHTAFTDIHFTIDDLVAEGDKVVVRWTSSQRHIGEFMGVAPTGKQITWTGMHLLRLVNGAIDASWLSNDLLGLLQQLGILPAIAPRR